MKKMQHAALRLRQTVRKLTPAWGRARVEIMAQPEMLAAKFFARPAGRITLVTERRMEEMGLLQPAVEALTGAGVSFATVYAEDVFPGDVPGDILISAGGDGPMAALMQRGRGGVHVPLVNTADGLSCLHLLAHAVEAALNPCEFAAQRKLSMEEAAEIIRWMRKAAEDPEDELASQRMQQSAAFLAVDRLDQPDGLIHAMAHAAGSGYADQPSYSAVHGAVHEAATAACLPLVLEAWRVQCAGALADLARRAKLASGSATDEVCASALVTWMKETVKAFGAPERIDTLKRAEIPALARRMLKDAPAMPVPMDRFEAERLLQKLIPPEEKITDALHLTALQRAYFESGVTLPVEVRREALMRLKSAILHREEDIHAALRQDLGKCPEEAYLCETGMVLSDLTHMIANISRFARRKRVPTPLHQFPGRSFTLRRPYGVVLIMSPWNYPFLLTLSPLVGAVAAGNCCVVKPSAYAPNTSRIIREICEMCFPRGHVAVVEGGRAENQELLIQRFDKIFFTGGETVGREVLRRAAEHLTPVTLELGGKSPVVVDETADIALAARRVAFGKLLNAGQTCVAPDYVLVHRVVRNEFVDRLKEQLTAMTAGNALENESYVHMINRRHFDRVMGLIDPERVVYGGRGDAETLRIQPTVMEGVTAQDAVMQEEIFGPVLPIVEVESLEEAMRFICGRPTPLALYLFTGSRAAKEAFLQRVPFGGGCINDTVIHLASNHLPFGGLGRSGMGCYHGRYSFECFSHEAGVVDKPRWLDLPMRYAPYDARMMKLVRLFLK